jgi:hypothetical protein
MSYRILYNGSSCTSADDGFIYAFELVMGEIQVLSQVKRKIYRGRGWLTGRILGR